LFSEAGHGKGAPDGVGAVVKRMTDEYVLRGGFVACASELVHVVEGSGVTIAQEVINECSIL
jgi:hypothetical protein